MHLVFNGVFKCCGQVAPGGIYRVSIRPGRQSITPSASFAMKASGNRSKARCGNAVFSVRARGDPKSSYYRQSVKTTEHGNPHGYDGAKKLSGRKRHLLVDTMGLVLKVFVHVADLQDRGGVKFLLEPIKGVFPCLQKVWVDQANAGKRGEWIEQEMRWEVEVVRHPWRSRGQWISHGDLNGLSRVWFTFEQIKPHRTGFRHLPQRWVVQNTHSPYP